MVKTILLFIYNKFPWLSVILPKIWWIEQIDLGCGGNKEEGFFGVDRFLLNGVDLALDLDKSVLPFSESSVSKIVTYHALEHIRNYPKLIKEVWRILKPDGQFFVCVPYYNTHLNKANFYHINDFNEHSFRFFSSEEFCDALDVGVWQHRFAPVWGLKNSDNSNSSVEFRLLKVEFDYFPEYKQFSDSEKYHFRMTRNNVVHNICFYLQAIKSESSKSIDDSDIYTPPRREWMLSNDW